MKDLSANNDLGASYVWRLWKHSIVPCHRKIIMAGEPRLVGFYFRTASLTRCVVRLEWKDDQFWVIQGVDAPWHVHASGEECSEKWADSICEKAALEWVCDEVKREFDKRRAA
jgi:hypothetical protein